MERSPTFELLHCRSFFRFVKSKIMWRHLGLISIVPLTAANILGPIRFTNVFDELKINRIQIFVMLWTEYNDSFVRTKYSSDSRSTQRGNPVIYIKLRHRTIHLVCSIAFAVALTFIMLFIFNLVPIPSLFIRFSPSDTAPFPNACNE